VPAECSALSAKVTLVCDKPLQQRAESILAPSDERMKRALNYMISQAREQRNASFSSSIRMKESPDSTVGAEMINSSQNLLFPSRPRAAAAAILKGAAQHKTRPKQQQLLERASYLKGVQRRERRLLKNARIFNIGDLP
jgi:hypothetical protein